MKSLWDFILEKRVIDTVKVLDRAGHEMQVKDWGVDKQSCEKILQSSDLVIIIQPDGNHWKVRNMDCKVDTIRKTLTTKKNNTIEFQRLFDNVDDGQWMLVTRR